MSFIFLCIETYNLKRIRVTSLFWCSSEFLCFSQDTGIKIETAECCGREATIFPGAAETCPRLGSERRISTSSCLWCKMWQTFLLASRQLCCPHGFAAGISLSLLAMSHCPSLAKHPVHSKRSRTNLYEILLTTTGSSHCSTLLWITTLCAQFSIQFSFYSAGKWNLPTHTITETAMDLKNKMGTRI